MPKPSFGCSTCRSRRIKCDEREGGCLNCERYGVSCPGYQNEFDVVLRFHTAPGQTLPSTGEGSRYAAELTGGPTIGKVSTPHLNQLALAMFYSNQCIDGSIYAPLELIESRGNGCLFAAIKALSSIDIVRTWTLPDSSDLTRTTYVRAIQLLNEALASPTEALRDSTLLATLIMTNIEMKAAPNQDSSYWQAHTAGAAALLQMRGSMQVTGPVGAALYFQVSSLLITTCMLARRQIPPELSQLRQASHSFLIDEAHPVWRHQGAVMRTTDLIARLAEGRISDYVGVITEAYAVYEELISVFTIADPSWHYQNVLSLRFADVVGYEHRYQSVLATQLWNSHRTAIALLCTTLVELVSGPLDMSKLPAKVRNFVNDLPRIVNQNALDTLAAVPQAVDLIGARQKQSQPPNDNPDICGQGYTNHTPVFQTRESEAGVVPFLHGCQIQWSVFFCVQSQAVAVEVRKYLWTVLAEAAQRTQMRQWQDLAEQLRQDLSLTATR